jgi:hypothetical protein
MNFKNPTLLSKLDVVDFMLSKNAKKCIFDVPKNANINFSSLQKFNLISFNENGGD